jgi:putative ABC transport system substrate-binding protein
VLTPAFDELQIGARVKYWLTERGWVEGANLRIESRIALGGDAELEAFAAELTRLRVDLLLTSGLLATQAAKRATTTVPIIFGVEGDPLREGLVQSVGRPGGNLTGMTVQSPEVARKRLQLLSEVRAKPRCVGVLWNPENREKDAEWRATEAAAVELGIAVRSLAVRGREDLEPAFASARQAACGALMVLSDRVVWGQAVGINALATRHRTPVMYPGQHYVRPTSGGGLMSYGPDQVDIGRDLAAYVERVLTGATPASLPVLRPSRFEFVLNLRAARAIGLTIPPAVLLRVDKIYE